MAHDDVLKFSSHDLGIHCYGGVRDVKVVYAASGHDLCTDKPAREKAAADEGRKPGFTSGPYPAFSGPAELAWTTRDGSKLAYAIDFASIFKDRVVLHKEDPKRIYQPKPMMTDAPTVVIEIDDRTVKVYMAASLQLLPEGGDNARLDIGRNYTLAFTKKL